MREKQDMAEQIGRFIRERRRQLLVAHAPASPAACRLVPDLRELAHLLLKFQDEPVVVALKAIVGGIGRGGCFELLDQFG